MSQRTDDGYLSAVRQVADYFWTVYSLGLRMQEGLNLQVGDIDANRELVHAGNDRWVGRSVRELANCLSARL